jgi:hypothetical protein
VTSVVGAIGMQSSGPLAAVVVGGPLGFAMGAALTYLGYSLTSYFMTSSAAVRE